MKILYAVDYYQPQLGYSEFFIPRQLQALGHEVIIFTSNYYFPFPKYDETAGKLLGHRQQPAGIFTFEGTKVIKRPMTYEIFTRAIFTGHKKILSIFQPDVVLINKIPGWNTVRFSQLKSQFGYKLISYDAHLSSGFYAEGNLVLKSIMYWSFRTFLAPLLAARVDKFVAVQEGTELIIRKFYGIKKNIQHIPLGTDTDRFQYRVADRNRIRSKYGLGTKDVVIIYTGKIIEEKGVSILFEACNDLFGKYPNLKLLLVGAGNETYIKRCQDELKSEYSNRVVWAGFQDNKDLPAFYSASDLGVWPLQESTAMNDAAACNLPFIANHEIGVKVRLSNKNALLYKKGNASDLAKQIRKLLDAPQERKAMGKRGRELMEQKLNWRSVVEEYLRL